MEPVQRRHPGEGPATLVTPSGAEVVFDGDTVTKLHREGTDPQALRQRLRIAGRCPELLAPRSVEPEPTGQRWRTRWPRVDVVAEDPVGLPWRAAGETLARLHRAPVDGFDVTHGAADRLARALGRLGASTRAGVVRRAAETLHVPEADRMTLVHGDFHLGQLARHEGRWLLVDLDDLGIGDPRWDLARPAGFWAAGLIPDGDWRSFVDGYRGQGGPALPDGDPWPSLDPFARAAVVAAAANHLDDDLLIAACERMR